MKMWITLIFTVVLVGATNGSIESSCYPEPTAEEIKKLFELFMIVPQVVPVAPKTLLTKIFNHHVAYLGTKIPAQDTRILPFTTWPSPNPDALHTIVGVDCDYPQFFNNTDGYQRLFEVIVNIPGPHIARGTVVRLEPISPAADTGDHRIVYLVYKQSAAFNVTDEFSTYISTNCEQFSVTNFVSTYGLGDPIAGNFFLAWNSTNTTYSYLESQIKLDYGSCSKCARKI